MVFLRKLPDARREESFRDKLSEMLTEFCLEAAVLISVLGVVDSVIAYKSTPGWKVLLPSFGFGLLFFLMGCIIQLNKSAHLAGKAKTTGAQEGELYDLRDP